MRQEQACVAVCPAECESECFLNRAFVTFMSIGFLLLKKILSVYLSYISDLEESQLIWADTGLYCSLNSNR